MAKEKASQEEIYRQMRMDIEAGSYPASSRLPSVRTLAKRFEASPNTISKVVSRLMESGLCNAKRGVGLFVRSRPTRRLTLLVNSTAVRPGKNWCGYIESKLCERLVNDGIETERFHITPDDPPYGPAVERIRRPGRVIVCLGLNHEPHLKAIGDLRRPMLLIGHAPNRTAASSVVPSSFRSGYLAARHLIRRGRRDIAFIGRRRQVRQVMLPEPESLKELAGVQCAFVEESLHLRPEFIFPDVSAVAERAASLRQKPTGIILPADDGVETVQALKALGGNIDRVVIGDERILTKARRPGAVVVKRDDIVDIAAEELLRLFSEQRVGNRNFVVDGELHEGTM